MKKKITFLIIISMLLLTGCQSKIDVTIDKGMINENISITLNDDELKTANNVKGEITKRLSDYEMDTEVLSYFNIKNYNKNINLEIDTSTVVNEINDSNSKLNIKIDAKVIITILIIIISLGLIFVLITLNKIRKANKI